MVVAVAKKKSERAKPGPKPDPARARSAVIMLRGRPEWKTWVERLAEFDRASSMNEFADRAFTAYARQLGFKEVAPPR